MVVFFVLKQDLVTSAVEPELFLVLINVLVLLHVFLSPETKLLRELKFERLLASHDNVLVLILIYCRVSLPFELIRFPRGPEHNMEGVLVLPKKLQNDILVLFAVLIEWKVLCSDSREVVKIVLVNFVNSTFL